MPSKVIPVGACCYVLNIVDLRVVSLGRASRPGLLPYPRCMSSSLAPEWIEVPGEKRLKMVPTQFLSFGGILLELANHVGTSTLFSVALIHSEFVK